MSVAQSPVTNSAKGVLVVDPLEARGVRYTRSVANARSEGIYVLFQIDTVARRTRMIPTAGVSSLKWREGSQCRFDINPDVSPLLKVFVMQASETGMPQCLAKGEMNLIDVFYRKESDQWISLSPCGQLDVELTFYQVVPMLPFKEEIETRRQTTTPRHQNGSSKVFDDEEEDKVVEQQPSDAQKMISSVDRVFEDDVKEERGRLKKLAMKVKRRYKESMTSNYADAHRRKASHDMLIHELKVSPEDKDLPEIPGAPPVPLLRAATEPNIPTAVSTSPVASPVVEQAPYPGSSANAPEPSPQDSNASSNSLVSDGTTFSRARADLSSLTLEDPLKPEEFDLSQVPFSASSIGSLPKASVPHPNVDAMRQDYSKKRETQFKKQYVPLTAEMYALVDRLEKGLVTTQDFKVDEGMSLYNGDGTWARGCLRDSVPTGAPPTLPPKIPVGMRSDEFFVLNKKEYVNYFRRVKSVRGI